MPCRTQQTLREMQHRMQLQMQQRAEAGTRESPTGRYLRQQAAAMPAIRPPFMCRTLLSYGLRQENVPAAEDSAG